MGPTGRVSLRAGFFRTALRVLLLASFGLAQAFGAPGDCDRSAERLDCARAVSAAFDRGGRLWVTWAGERHVYVQRSGDGGQNFSEAVAVNREPEPVNAGGEHRPKIAVGPEGNVYVAWTTPLDKPFTGHVRFSRSLDGGRRFEAPVTVNDDRSITSHRFVSLGVSASGRVYMAWLDKRDVLSAREKGQDYQGAAVYYTVSEDGGASFARDRRLAAESCECCRIALDFDRAGRPVMLWRDIYGDSLRDHSLAVFSDAHTPGPVQRVSEDGWRLRACPHHGPALAVDGGDTAHLAWFTQGERRQGLFYAETPLAEFRPSEPMSFGDYRRQAAHPAVLAVDGRRYLAWQEFDGETTAIKVMRAGAAGDWSVPVELAGTGGWADYPALVSYDGRAWLSWLTRDEGYRLIPLEQP